MEYFNAQLKLAQTQLELALHENQKSDNRERQVRMTIAALKAALESLK